jgi:rod shape-determining protein MreC
MNAFHPNPTENPPEATPWSYQKPKMQAFVARHRPFFTLMGALLAQLLLLSVQITRNRNVRLIQVWTVAVFDPLARSLHKVAGTSTLAWRTYGSLWRAEQQNQELNAQLVAARSQLQQLSEQAAESQRLRALLDFKTHLPLPSVAAEVIASSPGDSSNAIFIDKGSNSGLTPDLAVVTPEGVVGKIIAVFAHTSQVLLITDSSSGVGCLLEKSRTQGVLKGSGQASAELHYVMNGEPVAAGEAVLTSGLDQVYPKGLPVGTVINTGEGNIYKTIIVKPAAALNRLESVLVILNPSPAEQQATNPPTR